MNRKIVIQTALALEFQAVRAHLQDIKAVYHPITNSAYDLGHYVVNGRMYEILLCETGAGNAHSAEETGRALAFFQPGHVFFVGVAGGVKDVQLGDVVAASKVIGFEMGKDEDTFKPRYDIIPASYVLDQVARRIRREDVWQEKIRIPQGCRPAGFVGPIAAGEKVVAATSSVSFAQIKQYSSDALAVEMEGIGFLVGARPYNVSAMVVRGISDLIDKKGEADESGSQPIAAAHAAAFVFTMIDELDKIDALGTRDINDLAFRKRLVDIIAQLYTQGPEQDNIWKRAGGDVSILVNSASRKAQWFDAIEKLNLGGGGKDISLKSFMDEVNSDYPDAISELFSK